MKTSHTTHKHHTTHTHIKQQTQTSHKHHTPHTHITQQTQTPHTNITQHTQTSHNTHTHHTTHTNITQQTQTSHNKHKPSMLYYNLLTSCKAEKFSRQSDIKKEMFIILFFVGGKITFFGCNLIFDKMRNCWKILIRSGLLGNRRGEY